MEQIDEQLVPGPNRGLAGQDLQRKWAELLQEGYLPFSSVVILWNGSQAVCMRHHFSKLVAAKA